MVFTKFLHFTFSWNFRQVCRLGCIQTPGVLDRRSQPLIPSCGVPLQKFSDHSILYKIGSCDTETPTKDNDLCEKPDYGLSVFVRHSLWKSQGQASVLIPPLTLAMSFQTYSSSRTRRLSSYGSDGHHVGSSPWRWSSRERLPLKMRDHLIAKEFKNPSEMVLHADMLQDARRAQPMDPLLAAAATTPSSPSWPWEYITCPPQPNFRTCKHRRMLLS